MDRLMNGWKFNNPVDNFIMQNKPFATQQNEHMDGWMDGWIEFQQPSR